MCRHTNFFTKAQRFLKKGHTQMAVDSVYSLIQRKLKHREIFLPCQYSSLAKKTKLNPSSYEYCHGHMVVMVDHTFFKDYSLLLH